MPQWNKLLMAILMVLGVAGLVVSAVMLVMAVRFGEWGRVLFYGLIAALCIELVFIAWENRK